MNTPRDRAIAPTRLNPPSHVLGTRNAVMGSAGAGPHHVGDFTGPLSIKFMVRGSGTWRSEAGVHAVEEGWFLILNHGQTYTLDIDGGQPRESFCPFFRRGFVDDIHRTLTTVSDALLEDPEPASAPLAFHPHLHPEDARVVPALRRLRALIYDRPETVELEAAFLTLGEALVTHASEDLPARIARVPASRAATRAECFRRVARATDYLHAHAHEPIDLTVIARAACLSPYHFHRLFRAVHGEAPHQYLTRLRLRRARRLLEDTELPVTRIATAVGFDSPAAFSRRFARTFGLSPAGYRAAQFRKNGNAPFGRREENLPHMPHREPPCA